MADSAAMELCCLVCRSSENEELISVSCETSTARKSIREMIDIFVNVRASQILLDKDNAYDQESCRLPDQVCDQCLARLDRAYRLWKLSLSVGLIKKCAQGAEEKYRECRMCATKDDALVSMFHICKNRQIQIASMVEYLVGVTVEPGDRLPPYICMECLKDLNEGYGFKQDVLKSITFFSEQSLHPWQKMQFRADCPNQLVVDVSCKGVLTIANGTTVVMCSVCSLRIPLEQVNVRMCRGCRLEYRNYDDFVRQVGEHSKADEDELMEVFQEIVDYVDVADEDFGDMMNDEMFMEVEKIPVKSERKSVVISNQERKSSISLRITIEFKCCYEECYTYGIAEDLQKHYQEAHPEITSECPTNSFVCSICSASFPDASDLKNHMKGPYQLYKCTSSACPFVTRSHGCAMRHIEWVKEERGWRHGYPKPIDLKHLGKFFIIDKQLDENSFTLKRLHERCCWCGELFMELHELEEHRKLMHAVIKAPIYCETCNRPFDNLQPLSRHRLRSSIRTHYYCRPCEKAFWELAPFKLHQCTEHGTGSDEADQHLYDSTIFCCGCDEAFETTEQLEEHRQEKHPQKVETVDQIYLCTFCSKYFPTNIQLQAHLRKFQNGRLYRCLVLGCVFKTKDLAQIKNHVRCSSHMNAQGKTMTIRRVNPSIYYCCIPRCRFEHSSYEEIIKHVASVHEEKRQQNLAIFCDVASYKCEACFKNCRSELAFLNHKNGRTALQCIHCKKQQPRSELMTHEASCPERCEFVCEICLKEITGLYWYKLHLKSAHSIATSPLREKPKDDYQSSKLVCPTCGVLVRKSYLPSHIQMKHENKRAFKCKQCDMRFNVSYMLKVHIKNVHSTVKLYACRQGCDKRYKHSGDRQRHEQVVHLGIKPFVCEICSESFVRDRDLRLHSRKHTGRKLYSCEHCGDGFDRLTDFKEHQQICETAVSPLLGKGQ